MDRYCGLQPTESAGLEAFRGPLQVGGGLRQLLDALRVLERAAQERLELLAEIDRLDRRAGRVAGRAQARRERPEHALQAGERLALAGLLLVHRGPHRREP